MRVLFIGGTGIISTACSRLAVDRGLELTLLTRGQRATGLQSFARTLTVDIDDPAAAARTLGSESFDVVVDWIAFTPDHIERDLNLFRNVATGVGANFTAYMLPGALKPYYGDHPVGVNVYVRFRLKPAE